MSQVEVSNTIREWQETAPHWAKHSGTIRTMFAPVTRALIEQAGIAKGNHVLDVAGGPGEPSLTIAETVGPTGSVTCTDAVAAMVAAAQEESFRRGLTNVNFRRCTADSLPFADESFDAAVSRFGVMFFPDPLRACQEMLRVIKPGGVLAFVVWDKSELNPYSCVVTEVISRRVPTPAVDTNLPGAFRFSEPGKLAKVMIAAGATDVKENVLKVFIEAPISPADFWAMRSQTSETLREKLAKLSERDRAQISTAVQEAVRDFFPDNQMRFPAQMIIVTGRKA